LRKELRSAVRGAERWFGANGDVSDARIESFMADVLALEGESPEAIREGVHIALTDCGENYRAQEVVRPCTHKLRTIRLTPES
jgi:hypothetical protein